MKIDPSNSLRQFLPGSPRLAAGAFFLFMLGAGVAACPGPGYLPVVGPMPFRFAEPVTIAAKVFVLPPSAPLPVLTPIAQQIQKAQVSPAILPRPTPVSPAGELMEASSAPLPSEQNYQNQPNGYAPAPEPVVSPQMFLKFFNNAPASGSNMTTPLGFTQPRLNSAAPPPGPALHPVQP